MIKLIASDMDGTFLSNTHQISEKNIEAVNYAKENGIEFVIATGRAYYEAAKPLQEANLESELICFNGGITYDKEGNILDIVDLKPKDSYYIMEVFKSLGISYQLYTQNCVYTENIETDIQAFVDLIESHGVKADKEHIIAESKERQAKGHLVEVENVDLYINEPNNPLIKIIGISNDLNKLAKATSLLEGNKELSVTSSGENNVEVMHKNATKGIALKKFADKKNISLEATMALGDNLNDFSMLEVVKYSVAMANGNNKLKKIAEYITEHTNDNSGVGNAIFKIVEEVNNKENIEKELINKAIEATQFSYVPYSKFTVGAAVLGSNGKIYSGCNVENASYSPTNCAERTAIFKAVSEGTREFTKVAVVGGPERNLLDYCPPCGVCRQVIAEFASEDAELILGNSEDNYKTYKFFDEILPLSFTKKDLDNK